MVFDFGKDEAFLIFNRLLEFKFTCYFVKLFFLFL